MLDQAYSNQLESWLGKGPIKLTNIFTKATGDGKTSLDFHAAADGKGRTFSVIEVLPGTYYSENRPSNVELHAREIIGGYNPQSWSSIGNFNLTSNDADRTVVPLQSDDFGEAKPTPRGQRGMHQTFNASDYRPTFGGPGHDLFVPYDLSSIGYAYNSAYGPWAF